MKKASVALTVLLSTTIGCSIVWNPMLGCLVAGVIVGVLTALLREGEES